MSFRRFVHLVVDDVNIRRTYSLRNIDMSPLFRSPVAENQNMEPSPLPDPVMSFCPPRGTDYDGMNFMLLGGKHNKVVATDQTGRAVLYDPHSHAVTTLRGFAGPKSMPVALTINDGGDHLYVLDTHPNEICCVDTSFECLEFDDRGMDEDWYPRVLPPPPRPHNWDDNPDRPPAVVHSCAVSGDGSRIWVTDRRSGTYAFDTATEAWSKAGHWALPFAGAAEHVPKLGLYFGLRDFGLRDEDRCELCAVDLVVAPAVRGLWTDLTPAPAVRGLWTDFTPPPEWPVRRCTSRLVHLGGARFCIARFFTDDYDSCCFPVTHAVFTAVEVERCADDADDGGLRMVKHGSKLFTLLDDMSYWVL